MDIVIISPRVDELVDYNETRFSIDQNLVNFVNLLNMQTTLYFDTNSDYLFTLLSKFKIKGIILSGGGNIPIKGNFLKKSDQIRCNIDSLLINFALVNKIPIIGICRGMQYLNYFFGGSTYKVNNHVNVIHKIYSSNPKIISNKYVNSFHNLTIDIKKLPSNFDILAHDQHNNIEAIIDYENKLLGTMWHPERNKSFDKEDLDLYLSWLK
jgi:N5-(cytidine 5'-diphosphoramidyl)-L-glutamine hydrolase